MSSSMPQSSDLRLVMTRVFNADIQRVYNAWAKAENISRWMGPVDEMTCDVIAWDSSAGGSFRLNIKHPETGDHFVNGDFEELSPYTRVVFGWAWDYGRAPTNRMRIEIDLREVGERAELTLTQTLFADENQRDSHNEGWTGTFERLARVLTETRPSE